MANNNNATVSLSVAASKDKKFAGSEDETLVMVSVNTPSSTTPTPCDIVAVIDVSGSMGDEAKMQNAQGKSETHGLSLLDVVKHAVKTIINVLSQADRLAIVAYATNSRTVLDLTTMDEKGKKKATEELEALCPTDSTNLWAGLLNGMEVLRTAKEPGRLGSVLLLTDGQPNVNPPEGHIPALKKYKDQHGLPGIINTFGFGYNLDSGLLRDLASEGNGLYAFIPDSGFVGTVFVNASSNTLTVFGKNAQLALEPQNGASIVSSGVLGGHPTQYPSWGAQVALPPLQYDQPKNIVVRVKGATNSGKPFLSATLTYQTRDGQKHTVTAEGSTFDASQEGEIEAHRHRLQFVGTVLEATNSTKKDAAKREDSLVAVKKLIAEINGSPHTKSDKRVQTLLEDLTGQVTEAFSKSEYFTKWGYHYLPSLAGAHLYQVSNNFKDPGVQHYGSKLFNELRDRAEAIFVKMPPPKPSISHSTAGPVSSMTSYYSSGNPCFHGDCTMLMADGTLKKVKDVARGDLIMTSGRTHGEVTCVIRTQCPGTAELVELSDGLLITPYHPVQSNGQWRFPCDLATPTQRPCDAVYSFLLKEGHTCFINGHTCVTLGHNLPGDVVAHPYFGTRRVVEDLSKMNGWACGLVQLQAGCLVRDTKTSLVCGLRQ